MNTERALQALEELKTEATTPDVLNGGRDFTAWKNKTRGVIAAALPGDEDLLEQFDRIRYSLGMYSTSTPRSAHDQARHRGINTACGVIDAAIYRVRLHHDDTDQPVDAQAFDPGLWNHVRHLVEHEDWSKVASQTAIYVEDTIRTWAGDPRGRDGGTLVGKNLMAAVFAPDSELRCGRQASEWEGWRALAMGFAQALSNVDRHRISERADGRRYAIGVLGLGSLILTQLQHHHSDLIADRLFGTPTEPPIQPATAR